MLISYKAMAALLIFLTSLVTILYPLRYQRTPKAMESFALGEAFASGIFLGAAFFHMLPDALKTFSQLKLTSYPLAEAFCVLGFLILLFLERLSLFYSSLKAKNTIPYILTLVLIVHALTEGAALGVGATLSETLILFVAIIAHKGSESFALGITLLRHQVPLKRAIVISIFFAFMTPLGIAFGTGIHALTFVTSGQLASGILNAFAAGTFLYISTLHHAHFHEHKEDAQGILEFVCLVAGAAIMGVLAVWS